MKSGLLLFVLVLFPMGFASLALSQTSMRDTRRRPPLRHRRARALRKMETPRLIRAVLDAQAAAWNRGDIEGYMNGYDRSPKTEFVGGDSITRGWQEVLDRYKKRYDTREKLGTLTFSDLEITMLSKDAALVLGRWRLKRANDEPHGTFSLLFRKTKAGWRIVHDHSSAA